MEKDYKNRISDAFAMATKPKETAAAIDELETENRAAVSLLKALIEQIFETYPDNERRAQAIACFIYGAWFLGKPMERRKI